MSETTMLTKVLKAALQKGATDVHAKAGDVFRARVGGALVGLTKQRLTPAQTRALAATFAGLALDDPRLDTLRDFDASWGVAGVGRFRVNVCRQRSSFMVVLRVIPFTVPSPESLGLPEAVLALADRPRGILLVTGAGGSGKTTCIAALIHHLNRSRSCHIVTIEDPIEFLHRDLKGSVAQREVGTDTDDFAQAIHAALRQDPDVLALSELRDPYSLEAAVRAAEAGVLVIVSVTAPDAAIALLQVGAMLPTESREAGRMRLGGVLAGVVALRARREGAGELTTDVEWVDMTSGLANAITVGAELPPIRKLMEKAANAGRAELFTDPASN
jgi:twitching motility protein PilT